MTFEKRNFLLLAHLFWMMYKERIFLRSVLQMPLVVVSEGKQAVISSKEILVLLFLEEVSEHSSTN